jgi:hypothetical protein
VDKVNIEILVGHFGLKEVANTLINVEPHRKVSIIEVKGCLTHPFVAVTQKGFHLSVVTDLLNMFFE